MSKISKKCTCILIDLDLNVKNENFCLFVRVGPRSYQLIWQPPVMGSPLVGFGLKPKNNFNVFFTSPMLLGCGLGRERQTKRQEIDSCPKNLP